MSRTELRLHSYLKMMLLSSQFVQLVYHTNLKNGRKMVLRKMYYLVFTLNENPNSSGYESVFSFTIRMLNKFSCALLFLLTEQQ